MTLIDSLADLVSHMLTVAAEMENAGKDDAEVRQHGRELLVAVTSVRTWIDGLKEKESNQ